MQELQIPRANCATAIPHAQHSRLSYDATVTPGTLSRIARRQLTTSDAQAVLDSQLLRDSPQHVIAHRRARKEFHSRAEKTIQLRTSALETR